MRLLILGAALAAMSCVKYIGSDPKDSPMSSRAEGATGMLSLAARNVVGELLMVEDTAMVVMDGARIVRIPLRVVTHVSFPELGTVPKRLPLSRGDRNTLRLLSRHPYGVSQPVLQRMLEQRQQTAIETVDR
jgi:hypothetical protein